MARFPYITAPERDEDYTLHFYAPEELREVKLPAERQDRFENLAKTIFESFTLNSSSYPRFKWGEEGHLEAIALGVNCACVSRGESMGHISYYFHNVGKPHQAMAALQILSTYINALQGIESK